jgi:hypothetical protein
MKSIPYRLIALMGALAFAVTLAIMVGERLSTEAMAVLMGVVAGVAASIPTSLIVVWIAMQSMSHRIPMPQPVVRRETPVQEEAPRIVVVQQPNPAPNYAQANSWNPMPYAPASAYPSMPAPRSPRKFTIIGGVGEAEDVPSLQLVESEF